MGETIIFWNVYIEHDADSVVLFALLNFEGLGKLVYGGFDLWLRVPPFELKVIHDGHRAIWYLGQLVVVLFGSHLFCEGTLGLPFLTSRECRIRPIGAITT